MIRHAWALVLLGALTHCQTPDFDVAKGTSDCADRDAGCECQSEGQELPCYGEASYEGADLVCSIGTQVCRGGAWSACTGVEETRIHLANALIAPPTQCNPCNPACHVATDDSIESSDLTPDNSDSVQYDPVTGGVISEDMIVEDETTIGVGGDEPFDTTMNPNDGVELDTDGAIVLGNTATINDSIWIANTGEGTVSRFDIDTFTETGRFWVGPHGRGNDPSRTSINTAGDAFVAGRRGLFLTKISGLSEACPDTNGDGVITTSTNGTALPWGQDDCVLWSTSLRGVMPGGYIRAVAAQDIVDPISGNVTERVWVGGYSDRRISVLDGATGGILMTTHVQYGPYGMAFDGSQNLWISTISHRQLVRVDTTRCNEFGCPWAGTCVESSSTGSRCEGAIKRAIPTPNSNRPYGVTVDAAQRIWLGGDRDVQRYDPTAPAASRWATAGIGTSGGWKAGIAVDGSGNVWTTGSFGVYRLDADNPRNRHLIRYGAASNYMRGWGVAIAADDRAWIIGRWENSAWVVEPGAALTSNTITRTAYSVRSPYTYSDMTGQQLRLAATPRGTYVMSFEGCGDGTRWENLVFDIDTPPDTSVAFRVRTADTMVALNSATWHGVGVVPAGTSPLAVGSVLDAAGVTHGMFAQVEVALESSILDPSMFVTPRVRSVQLNHFCATPSVGYYQREYDGTGTCNVTTERPFWNMVDYRVDTPGDSFVEVYVRAAETEAGLNTAPEATVTIPALPDSGALNLQPILAAAGLPVDPFFLRVRMQLNPSTAGQSAILYSMSTRWECRPNL